MDSIQELIKLLNTADKKLFRKFLQRKNKRGDVKNLQLLDLIETDDINGLNKLYEPEKKMMHTMLYVKGCRIIYCYFYLRKLLKATVLTPMRRCAWWL